MGILRFFLAISVLIVHSSPIFGLTLIPGYLAVRSFYIMSGFLMALVILEKYQFSARPYFFFISNRFLRIYPLYFIVIILTLLVSLIFGLVLGSYGKLEFYKEVYAVNPSNAPALFSILLINFTLFGQDILTFFGLDHFTGLFYFLGLQKEIVLQELLLIPIAWTVAVEFSFYLVAPLIITKNRFLPLIWLIGVIVLRLVLYHSFNVEGSFFIYRFAPVELSWFLLGVITYQAYKSQHYIRARYASWLLGVLILSMIAYDYIKIGGEAFDIIFYTLIVVSLPPLFLRFQSSRLDKYLGDLCYPIYISHCLFLLLVDANRFPKPFGKGLPLFVLTIIFSIAVTMIVLNPLENYRRKRIRAKIN